MALSNRQRDTDSDIDDSRMTFLEHLEELRTRLIWCCVALAAGMVLSLAFVKRLAAVVTASMVAALPAGSGLILTKPGEGFAFYLDLSLIGGITIAAPLITYQAWRFIAPGLHANEKRLIIPFVMFAVAGSLAGAAFSHRVLFPSMMAFFQSFDSPQMRFMPRVEDTFALYKNMLISMVLIFQIPTLVFVLARLRAVTAGWLVRHLRYAVLAAVTMGAIITPSSDPWNQLAFSVPVLGMYVIGIVVAWVCYPRGKSAGDIGGSSLKLVFAATVLHEAQRGAAAADRPRLIYSRRPPRSTAR